VKCVQTFAFLKHGSRHIFKPPAALDLLDAVDRGVSSWWRGWLCAF